MSWWTQRQREEAEFLKALKDIPTAQIRDACKEAGMACLQDQVPEESRGASREQMLGWLFTKERLGGHWKDRLLKGLG
jgi:hypothetical protein